MKRILVIDDSRFTCNEIKALIPQDEYEVVGHALNGEEGIRLYEELNPDIVTMDIIMPGLDGIEATTEIIAIDQNASKKIIFLSSLCDMDTLNEIQALGIKHFVSKPFDKEALIATLSEIGE